MNTFNELQQRNRDLEILTKIIQAVHRSSSLDDVYNTALDEVMQLENVDMAMIYLVDEEKNEAVIKAQRNLPDFYLERASRIAYPKGVTWKSINAGQIINVEDIQKDPDIGPAGRRLGHHSIFFLPIFLEDKVIGVIEFLSYKERQFYDREVRLLTSIGNQIAVAISRTLLNQQLVKQNNYKEIINVITDIVHSSITLKDVIDNAIDAMEKNIDFAKNILFYMVEGDEAVLKAYNKNLEKKFLEKIPRIPYPRGATWKTILERQPRYIPDVEQDETVGSAGIELGIMSGLTVPIEYMGEGIGCIHITSDKKHSFGKAELELLKSISRQIETAIANTRNAENLRESEERYRTLFEQSPAGVFIFNRDLVITNCNDRLADMLNTTKTRVKGLDLKKLKDNTFVEGMEKVLKGENYYKKEAMYNATLSNSQLWLSIQVSPLFDSEQNVIGGMAVVEDITEKKLSQERLLQAQRLESIGILAGGIAHNLNNLLQPIMLSLQSLRDRFRDEESRNIIDILEESAHRGKSLINQVLSFARGSKGEFRPLEVNLLLKDIKKLLDQTFSKDILINIDVENDLHRINGDITKLHQVIMNICVNARDSMKNGGVLNINAENVNFEDKDDRIQSSFKPGSYVMMKFTDSGTGIPEENLGKIFDPFFTTKQPGEGTGLGLSVSYSIIKEHEGVIRVKSKPGEGTEFRILIPAIEDNDPYETVNSGSIVTKRGEGELIIVIDDEEAVLNISKLALERNGYRTKTYSNGRDALETFRKSNEDITLVILDMMMPVMNGPTLIEELKKVNPKVKILVSTGMKSGDKGFSDLDEIDVADIIMKPYSSEELLDKIYKIIHGS